MTVFDAHCDTIQRITDMGGNLFNNPYHFDILRIKAQKTRYIQIFAAFINKKADKLTPYLRFKQLADRYFEEIENNKEHISHCISSTGIKDTVSQGKIAAILSVEGGETIEGDIEKLRAIYDRGVRVMTLTWNFSNEISGSIGEKDASGLSEFGKKVVLEMNKLGMLIDVPHISEKGFWDVMEISKAPIAATHSNAKSVCDNARNLDDEQIRAIIKNGGCIGVNMYSKFVSNGTNCSIKDVLKHIEHILSLGGEDHLGLGCDFDGIDFMPCEMKGAEDLYKIFDEMQRLGYSNCLIKKIFSDNFLNLLEKILI